MTPIRRRRSPNWYIKRRWPEIGRVERSLGTRNTMLCPPFDELVQVREAPACPAIGQFYSRNRQFIELLRMDVEIPPGSIRGQQQVLDRAARRSRCGHTLAEPIPRRRIGGNARRVVREDDVDLR